MPRLARRQRHAAAAIGRAQTRRAIASERRRQPRRAATRPPANARPAALSQQDAQPAARGRDRRWRPALRARARRACPASATASAMPAAESFAASYSRAAAGPSGRREILRGPGRFLKRRSIIATSSRQSMPSILKVDSACSSQTVHGRRHRQLDPCPFARAGCGRRRCSCTCSSPCAKSRRCGGRRARRTSCWPDAARAHQPHAPRSRRS